MNSGKTQNPFGPHLLALLSLLPCFRFRIWISGCQTLQCPLTPRLSHPLSYLFLSCPQFSTSFSFWLSKILSVVLMLPLDSSLLSTLLWAFCHHSLPFTGHLTFLFHFTAALCFHACVWCFQTRCVQSVLFKKCQMFSSTAPVIDVLVVMTSMQMWTLSCWNLIYGAISICLSYYWQF